jgi:hypothetical protein
VKRRIGGLGLSEAPKHEPDLEVGRGVALEHRGGPAELIERAGQVAALERAAPDSGPDAGLLLCLRAPAEPFGLLQFRGARRRVP